MAAVFFSHACDPPFPCGQNGKTAASDARAIGANPRLVGQCPLPEALVADRRGRRRYVSLYGHQKYEPVSSGRRPYPDQTPFNSPPAPRSDLMAPK